MRTLHKEHPEPYNIIVKYLSNEEGSIEVHFCSLCGGPVGILCEHSKNTWVGPKDKQKLICDLCGMVWTGPDLNAR